jgi:hypothetical protein
MALTRKFLTALGLEQDKVDEIIQAHTETVDGLKEQRDALKSDADKLPEVMKELEGLKKQVAENGDDPYEAKYDELKKEFDDYKAEVEEQKTTAKKTEAYRGLLKKAGISDKRTDSVLRVSATAIEGLEFADDGSVKDADNIVKGIADEWSDFVVTKKEEGTRTATPPTSNSGSTMTKKEILAIKDNAERHKKMAENPELFGLERRGE